MKPLVSIEDDAPRAHAAADEAGGWRLNALWAALALLAVLFLGLVAKGAVLKPYADQYAFLYDVLQWKDGRASLPEYLWHPHVGHHTVWVRLLTLAELQFTGSAWLSVAVCALLMLGAAALLFVGARRLTGVGWLRTAAAVLCAGLMLGPFSAFDANQPENALYPFCILFALASVLLFTREGAPRAMVAGRIGAMACAVAAALGNGAALALWAVLAVLAALTPGPRRWMWMAAVIAVGGLFSALYLGSRSGVSELAAAGGGSDNATGAVVYILDFIAQPWSQASNGAGALMGLAMLALTGWLARAAWLRGPTAADRFAFGCALFSVATACLAAAGRGGLGAVMHVPVRYTVFAVPLQAAIVILGAPLLLRRFGDRATGALALAVAGLMLVQQVGGGWLMLRALVPVRQTIADYEAGRRTPEWTHIIYPDLTWVAPLEARLKAERIFGKAPQELAPPAPSVQGRTP